MTEAPPTEPTAPPRVLQRSGQGRMITGVAAGLGRYTGIDPVVFRVGFAVLVLGSGIGIALYLAAFLLMRETNGAPGYLEQWTRRDFDAETVLALLTGVFAFGLIVNLASGGIGTPTLVVATVLAVSLLAAHAGGVDLLALARSMPERLNRRRRASDMPPFAFPDAPEAPRFPASEPAASHEIFEDPPRRPDPVPAQTQAQAQAHAEPCGLGARPTRANPQPANSEPTYSEPTYSEPAGLDYSEPASLDADRYEPSQPSGTRAFETDRSHDSPAPYAYGEPFAPRGPYQPLDPRRREGYSPYDLSGGQAPPRRRKRSRSFTGAFTFLLALIIGGIVMAVQARSPGSGLSLPAIGGAMLITVGAGLLVATWFGRGAGLIALGTVLSVVIAAGLMFGEVPKQVGYRIWTPTSAAEAARTYEVGIGEGTLDLTGLKLAPGTSATFNAQISVGELTVIVPPTARVEVHATARIGDIQVDHAVQGGTDLSVDKVLEPEVTPKGDVSTIVLNLKGGIGDVVVRRAA